MGNSSNILIESSESLGAGSGKDAPVTIAVGSVPVVSTLAPMKPSVGRIVHWVAPSFKKGAGAHLAALITGVSPDGLAHLRVFATHDELDEISGFGQSARDMQIVDVPFDEVGKAGGTWHWPER